MIVAMMHFVIEPDLANCVVKGKHNVGDRAQPLGAFMSITKERNTRPECVWPER